LLVIKGKMKICTEHEEVVLGEMDSAFVDENEPHSGVNIGEEKVVGIDIFIPGRSFDFWRTRSG